MAYAHVSQIVYHGTPGFKNREMRVLQTNSTIIQKIMLTLLYI
jgi:hypothetical protein